MHQEHFAQIYCTGITSWPQQCVDYCNMPSAVTVKCLPLPLQLIQTGAILLFGQQSQKSPKPREVVKYSRVYCCKYNDCVHETTYSTAATRAHSAACALQGSDTVRLLVNLTQYLKYNESLAATNTVKY